MLTIGPRADLTGTIIYDNECRGCRYGVYFDGGFEGGHDFMGMIGTPTGWWCYGNALELIEPVEDPAITVDLEEVL